eukprot:Skav217287  [mRNA]  locus=scaffold120:281850:283090:+ [translate_table: standard]
MVALWGSAFTAWRPGGLTARNSRPSKTQRAADASMLTPFGPVVTYAKERPVALMDAASEKKEVVLEEWLDRLLLVQSNPKFTAVQKAKATVELLQPLKSTVMPKFIDVKLVMEVEPNLIGGLQVEWGYTDPQNRNSPTHGIDLSLKNILGKRALEKGVVQAL